MRSNSYINTYKSIVKNEHIVKFQDLRPLADEFVMQRWLKLTSQAYPEVEIFNPALSAGAHHDQCVSTLLLWDVNWFALWIAAAAPPKQLLLTKPVHWGCSSVHRGQQCSFWKPNRPQSAVRAAESAAMVDCRRLKRPEALSMVGRLRYCVKFNNLNKQMLWNIESEIILP